MSLVKLGEAITITAADIQSAGSVLAEYQDPEILERFKKVAAELKSIAPKAKDFLYFSAVMMHAAEASLLNADGSLRKDASGNDVTANWEKSGESWRWVCSDSTIKPYKNSNNDIFPEEELIKAYKKWVGRPLCLDHKSSSVDMIRGVIVDTFYDRPNKRVVALCALDKVNYPDLARKVATGYATSVSMGTAVGKAICTDCGRVARTESDFCDDMRRKSCYGEINVDLNPIELSIVVNGADPKAKIRHIVAAADSIAQYVEQKQAQLSKIAEDETRDIELAKEIGNGLAEVLSKVLDMQKKIEQLQSNEEAEQSRQGQEAAPTEAAAKEDLMVKSAAPMLESILSRIEELDKKFNKLSKNSEETQMTNKNAYFQGGGDGNEPTPGKPKYEKEPTAEQLRNNVDKQMVGQMDTGSVEGMHPGYDSFGESEEARKKRLQRLAAEQEARQLRRVAALEKAKENLANQKEAYFQGTEEPTPGKPKYPKEDSDKLRDKEDKQMVGQPPFPGVGSVDGLHPSPASADVKDELKRKQMLARAKLIARFVKAANSDGTENQAESRWQVFADDKLVLSATVNEITGGRVGALYDSVATKDFGKNLLAKVRSDGFDKVAGLLKSAQGATAAPSPMPAVAAEPAGPAPDMGMGMGGEEPTADAGGSGDPKDQLPELLTKAENVLADIRQGVEALLNNSGNELAGFEELGGEGVAPATASLVTMQKKLSRALLIGMKQADSELTNHVEELRLAKHIYDNQSRIKKADAGYVSELVVDACSDANTTIADCYKLMEAFVKYARGTDALVKHASKEAALVKSADELMGDPTAVSGMPGDPLDPTLTPKALPKDPHFFENPSKDPTKGLPAGFKGIAPAAPGAGSAHKAPKPAPKKPAPKTGPGSLPEPYGDRSMLESNMINVVREGPLGGKFQTPQAPPPSGQMADDGDMNDVVEMKPDGSMTGSTTADVDAMMKANKASKEVDLTTKEGRAMYRAKLAEKGLAFSDMLGKAHKGGVTTQLDVKPTGDLAKVETLEETHKAMMDVAQAPPKVRKDAEAIQKLVVAGRINPETDFPGLIAQGLDKDAVAYWKAFWGDAGKEGSQFAAELVKEHASKKMAEEKETYQVKLSRAYEVAYDMVRRGMIGDDRHALNQQVGELMKFNDDGFESMKRWVERQPFAKTASIPQVGLMGGGEVVLPAPEAAPSDFVSELERAFSNRKY